MANCDDRRVRRHWVQRILDHDGYGDDPGGIESWLRLAEAVGLERSQVESLTDLLPGVRFAVDAYVNFARRAPWHEAACAALTELFAPRSTGRGSPAGPITTRGSTARACTIFRAAPASRPRCRPGARGDSRAVSHPDGAGAGDPDPAVQARRALADERRHGASYGVQWMARHRHLGASGRWRGLPPAVGAGAGRARTALSRRDGETQPQRRGDHDALRRRANGAAIVADIEREYATTGLASDVHARLHRARARALLAGDERMSDSAAMSAAPPGPPLWLLLELTYRCPLHCVFCYNPTDFGSVGRDSRRRSGCAFSKRRGRWVGAARTLGRRAARPAMTRDDRRRRTPARLLYQPHHLGGGSHGAAAAGIEGSRARPHPALLPGQRAPDERLPEQHPDVRAEVARGRAHQEVSLSHGPQRGAASPQHRSCGGDPRHGRAHGRRVRRARQHPVLRLGVAQSRRSCCRAARSCGARRKSPRDFASGWARACGSSSSCPTTSRRRPKPCMNGLGRVFLSIAPDGVALPCQAARMLPDLDFPERTRERASARSGTTRPRSIATAARTG